MSNRGTADQERQIDGSGAILGRRKLEHIFLAVDHIISFAKFKPTDQVIQTAKRVIYQRLAVGELVPLNRDPIVTAIGETGGFIIKKEVMAGLQVLLIGSQ